MGPVIDHERWYRPEPETTRGSIPGPRSKIERCCLYHMPKQRKFNFFFKSNLEMHVFSGILNVFSSSPMYVYM